ncbi:hypothetical protein [Streptomyces sp. KL116D]|uniref:hypothetical protein n=1 Tax=Streptomyces sp. KL116D TaxID=3045152 RepID=UPI003555CA8C
MTAQTHGPLDRDEMPRPERTPAGVRMALARIAPHRLSEMERHKEEALAAGLRSGNIQHLSSWLDWWMAEVEIERRTDLRMRRDKALAAVHESAGTDDPAYINAMAELRQIQDTVRRDLAA